MTPLFSRGSRGFMFLPLAAALVAPLAGQSLLCVDNHGKASVVRQVRGGDPYVMENGKLVPVVTERSMLKPTISFLPAFISVRDLEVGTRAAKFENGEGEANHRLHFQANFESLCQLDNVFFVLEFDTKRAGKAVFYYEVGNLEPGKPQQVGLTVKLRDELGEGHYQLHLFADGAEVLHSEQSASYREAAIALIVAQQIAGMKDALPKPFFGPEPEYPAALFKAGTKGEAVMKIRIAPTGVVLDSTVERATDPAFAEAALAAVRQWCFLPQMKDGHPVESWATMPFDFAPPPLPGKT